MVDVLRSMRDSASMRVFGAIATLALCLGFAAPAFATGTDPVADGFASGQTSMTTYIGLGVGVIVALLLLGIGVTILVKYIRKAARAA